MRKSLALCVTVFVWLALMQASPAYAHYTQHLTVEDLAQKSSFIVEGTVIDVRSDWNSDQTVIYTYVDVQVAQKYKGADTPPVMSLRLMGGQVDDVAFSFMDGPAFTTGEQVMMFLGPNPHAEMPFVGVGEGLFHVTVDPSGVERVTNSHGTSFSRSEMVQRIQQTVR